jgi:uncharacterized membrane protein YvbJ
MKYCGKCKQHKPEDEFYDLQSWCKECIKEYQRRHRQAKAALAGAVALALTIGSAEAQTQTKEFK